ncbi:hypothetical protein HPC49_33370 [Pyxidicoccus fallax]|uniref:Uncharacterized protein n=1 Tax=Pyxidicoccus fallax TaxID=394095 RepID=A0A848LKS1_9BACT|nr:hypothetical protein [Pyxidicoccus fallax]NMO18375.1 hypothetical protein [Pyxidicoccus fallax]NPC83099.1 hypothetical protein [Pyxidicoccus fallax]
MSVQFLLTPPEGLLDVLTPARLASFRKWFVREWTDGEGPLTAQAARELQEDVREDLETYLRDIQGAVDHLREHGASALKKPLPSPFDDVAVDLLDELAEFFARGGLGADDVLMKATERSVDDKDLRAAEAVVGSACPGRTQQLWRHLVWGRAPWTELGVGIQLQREVASLGYWTRAEVRQVRDDLREHLGGPPRYKPVRAMARFTSLLQRTLSRASRGDAAAALDAVSKAVDRAGQEGSGLLVVR